MQEFICGETVTTKIGNIIGMITCKSIRFDSISYEFTYFYNGEQKCIWIRYDEVISNNDKSKIGFTK